MLDRLGRLPRLPLLSALLAAALCLPTLGVGLQGDDHFQRAVLEGAYPGAEPLWDLFRFVGGPADPILYGDGMLVWWAAPDLRLGFLRPLTAATHLLDHHLVHDALPWHHAHSLLWLAAATALLARFYRGLLPPIAAAVAALAFAADDAHAVPAGWLANRNALIALTFSVGAWLAHRRWREEGGARLGVAAAALLATAMAAGEAAICGAAYIAAYQMTMDTGPWRRRITGLLPATALVLFWRLTYDTFGYGAYGSGAYIDPGATPLRFLLAAVQRWPLLHLGAWTNVPVDVSIVLPPLWHGVLVAFAWLAAGAGLLLLTPLRHSKEARFLLLGGALSTLPVCATFPMSRLLLFPGVGVFGLIGLLAVRATGWRRPAVLALLVLHGPVAALGQLGGALGLKAFGGLFAEGATQAPVDDAIRGQTLVFVNGNDFNVMYTPLLREASDDYGPSPDRVAQLGSQLATLTVAREDARTLLVTPDVGFLASPLECLLRDPHLPFTVGDRVRRPDFEVEVTAVDGGRPMQARFRFDRPLEDARYRWVRFGDDGLVPFDLPAIGGSATVPSALPLLSGPG